MHWEKPPPYWLIMPEAIELESIDNTESELHTGLEVIARRTENVFTIICAAVVGLIKPLVNAVVYFIYAIVIIALVLAVLCAVLASISQYSWV
jgi:hypothetical protein